MLDLFFASCARLYIFIQLLLITFFLSLDIISAVFTIKSLAFELMVKAEAGIRICIANSDFYIGSANAA